MELRIQVPVSILHDEEKNTHYNGFWAVTDVGRTVGAEKVDSSDEGARSRVR
jgi:hypothetical protein